MHPSTDRWKCIRKTVFLASEQNHYKFKEKSTKTPNAWKENISRAVRKQQHPPPPPKKTKS